MLVKYADRGLVSKGQVSPLFDQLYMLTMMTVMMFNLGQGFVNYLRPDPNIRNTVLKVCINQDEPPETQARI